MVYIQVSTNHIGSSAYASIIPIKDALDSEEVVPSLGRHEPPLRARTNGKWTASAVRQKTDLLVRSSRWLHSYFEGRNGCPWVWVALVKVNVSPPFNVLKVGTTERHDVECWVYRM